MNKRSEEQNAVNQEFTDLVEELKNLGMSTKSIAEMSDIGITKLHNILSCQSSATPLMISMLKDGLIGKIAEIAELARIKKSEK